MATSPIEYRHEHVSGVVFVTGSAAISARVANRGATVGRAKVLVRSWTGVVLESVEGLDIPNGVVEAGGVWIFDESLPRGIDVKGPIPFWVQILTTSPDLVPSLAFEETVLSNGEPEGTRETAYFAPGDFAAFPLHLSPVEPPHVGPLKVGGGA